MAKYIYPASDNDAKQCVETALDIMGMTLETEALFLNQAWEWYDSEAQVEELILDIMEDEGLPYLPEDYPL